MSVVDWRKPRKLFGGALFCAALGGIVLLILPLLPLMLIGLFTSAFIDDFFS